MKKAFRLFLTTIAIAILLSTGMAQTHARRLEIGIDISAMRHISLPDSIDPETHTDFERQWKYLLMKRKLNPTDSTVIWPRFVRFCINTFNWIDRTFNSYDTLYVKPHHLKGKAMLVCDNWTDYYDFHPRDVIPVVMSSKYHPSIGLYAQYSILSVGYSIDVNTLFKNEKSNTTRFDFAFSCAKFNFEAHYWYNSGGIYIRDFGDFRKDTGKKGLLDIKFDGMTFRGLNVTAYHFFNSRKYSQGAAYNTSNIQLRSAGSWGAGLEGAFYKANFNFDELPQELRDYYNYPIDTYKLHYNSVNAIGGYAYNWVCNKHFLANVSAFPKLGACFSYANTTLGKKTLLSTGIDFLASLNYSSGRWFAAFTSKLGCNAYYTHKIGFVLLTETMQASFGIRF